MTGLLIVPAILNLLTSLVWISLGIQDNMPMLSIGMFLVVIGILCLMYSRLDIKKMYEKRKVILTFGILLIPFNFISAIVLMIASDKIGDYYANSLDEKEITEAKSNEKNIVSKEVKKVDILLKIGIVMVTIAGIMIATTSWDVISDFVKMIIIALIGGVFLGLSFFSEKKLKIRGTTITYWLLSMIAFSLSIFMIGNFEILGNWFSVNGDGADIFTAVLITCIAGFSYITYRKFRYSSLLYISVFCVAIAAALVIRFISSDKEISLLVLTIIVALMSFIPKSERNEIKALKLFHIVLSFITTVLLIAEEMNSVNEVVVILTALIQIVNLIVIAILDKREEFKVLSGIGIVAIVTMALTGIYLNLDDIIVLLINRSIILCVALLICFALVRNSKINNIILAIVLPILILSILFTIEIPIAIYIGFLTLAMIIFGVFKKDYKALYIEGIIFMIANLVIQLWEFWGLLPIWAYLLVGGFSLIGIVTVRELKKSKQE